MTGWCRNVSAVGVQIVEYFACHASKWLATVRLEPSVFNASISKRRSALLSAVLTNIAVFRLSASAMHKEVEQLFIQQTFKTESW